MNENKDGDSSKDTVTTVVLKTSDYLTSTHFYKTKILYLYIRTHTFTLIRTIQLSPEQNFITFFISLKCPPLSVFKLQISVLKLRNRVTKHPVACSINWKNLKSK